MMPLWRPGTPHGGDLSGHDEYTMWDAAYVLGSLSSAERREFEAHMTDCPLCGSAVGELSGMPALLSQLDRDELAAIDDRSGVESLPAGQGELAAAPVPHRDVDGWGRRSRGAGDRCACRRCGPAPDIRAHAAAGERVGSADGASRDEQADLDGLAQQPAVGNVHLDELRLLGSAERPSRHASDGRGRSRRQPHSDGNLGGESGPHGDARCQYFNTCRSNRLCTGGFRRRRPTAPGAFAVDFAPRVNRSHSKVVLLTYK